MLYSEVFPVFVNGIQGIVRESVWDEGKENQHPSTFLTLYAGTYGYCGTAKKFPLEGEDNVFAKTYFILQSLVEKGFFYPPYQGDDGLTYWNIFWHTKQLVPVDKLMGILKTHGLEIELRE